MIAPPGMALKLLRLFCKGEQQAEVKGDLLEAFGGWVEELGPTRAKRRLWREVLTLSAWNVVARFRGVRGGRTVGRRALSKPAISPRQW